MRGCHSHRQDRIRAQGDRNFWSAIRYNGNNAWYANGNTGYFNNNDMYNLLWVLPVSNYKQSQHKADEAMIELQDIMDAYLVARANKRRTADQTDFELHWEMNCVRLYRDIVSRRLRPTAYAFVTMQADERLHAGMAHLGGSAFLLEAVSPLRHRARGHCPESRVHQARTNRQKV